MLLKKIPLQIVYFSKKKKLLLFLKQYLDKPIRHTLNRPRFCSRPMRPKPRVANFGLNKLF